MASETSRAAARFNSIPVRLRNALYPFQIEGVKYIIRNNGRALVGDEMGLGKTVQAIASATAFRESWPVLVIVPAVVKLNWAEEFEMWLSELEPGQVHVVRGRSDVLEWATPGVKVVIATYGLFTDTSEVASAIAEHDFGFVIVDESHYLKSRSAARTKLIVPILKDAPHAVLLSGTPALARPVELYPQITSVCAPEDAKLFGNSFTAFTKRYCNARRGRFGWDVSGCSNLDELSEKLRKVMIRRRKATVLTQLPPKTKRRIPIELSGKAAQQLKRCMEHLRKMGGIMRLLRDNEGGSGDNSDARRAFSVRNEHRRLLMEAFQLTGEAKIKGVKDYVEQFLLGSDVNEKLIIFAHHLKVLDGIEEGLASHRGAKKSNSKSKVGSRIEWMRIDGATPHSERTANARKFQTDPRCRVALIGMTSGGIGITLTAAAHVFFAELHWTPGVLAQAEDRAHRIGQDRKVNVHYLIGRNSLDDSLWNKIVNKVSVVSEALEGCKERLKVAKVKANASSNKRRKLNTEENLGSEFESDENDGNSDVPGEKRNATEPIAKGDLRSFFRNASSQSSSPPTSSSQSSTGSLASPPASSAAQSPYPFQKTETANSRNTNVLKRSASALIDKDLGWQCVRCTLINKLLWLRCNACGATRSSFQGGIMEDTAQEDAAQEDAAHEDAAQEDAAQEDAAQEDAAQEDAKHYGEARGSKGASSSSKESPFTNTLEQSERKVGIFFSVSPYSGRVYLYGKDKRYLNQSLMPADLPKVTQAAFAASTASSDKQPVAKDTQRTVLPSLLLESRAALKEFEQFLDSWNSLRPVEKSALTSHIVRPPLHAELSRIRSKATANDDNKQRKLSFKRYSSARELRKAASSSSQSDTPSDQSASRRICCNCLKPSSCLLTSGTCSWKCHQELSSRVSGSAIRRQLFELEKGICTLCKRDMHAVFQRFKRLQPSDRVQELMRLHGFKVATSNSAILQNPVEGHFWQADHVLPVAEGGGECSLHNIRTLCTPCHQRETAKLQRRLKDGQLGLSAKGTKDIRGFFTNGKRAVEVMRDSEPSNVQVVGRNIDVVDLV